ncbi:MAG TPA: 2,3-epoxybenzoyl-CoA dihydrolase [Sandaracinaceae bacterium LLY-WYZ-13_1]|nr:2,3-epoxybenzoyl-CoA dihydrolase [Sandaracinaceae bacterium LLY-WYZ-13_1]
MAISFDTHPDEYKHWTLRVDGERATLTLDVDPHGGLRSDYELKLNSYDLGVDIELADAVQRLRFEHPEVKAVIVDSGQQRVFCAGANIPMLGGSTHAFKVNFCKFTNETRLSIEDASARSDQKYVAALNGTCAGGGYELAMACDHILLIDDGASAVSLPEVPLLGVLPGTGGLTRLVDKRRVRRDRADVFCTTSEGVRGKRAVEWGLVDEIAPRSKFEDAVRERAEAIAKASETKKGPGITLDPVTPRTDDNGNLVYRHVTLELAADTRTAVLKIRTPEDAQPASPDAIQAAGADQWSLRAFRELDDALLRLRVNHLDIGLVVVRAEGDLATVLDVDRVLHENREHWLANEILAFQARVLRRMDLTSKSFFSLVDEGTAFGGSLLELALASDRIYMLEHDDDAVSIGISALNGGAYPMSHGLTRLQARFLGEPAKVDAVLEHAGKTLVTGDADELGLVTWAADDIDWEDDIRIALEERVSLSPDALTGMEASLRFPGPESADAKIFARLSAWQNWIFQRPNAVGPEGALTKYGEPDRPSFQWTRC